MTVTLKTPGAGTALPDPAQRGRWLVLGPCHGSAAWGGGEGEGGGGMGPLCSHFFPCSCFASPQWSGHPTSTPQGPGVWEMGREGEAGGHEALPAQAHSKGARPRGRAGGPQVPAGRHRPAGFGDSAATPRNSPCQSCEVGQASTPQYLCLRGSHAEPPSPLSQANQAASWGFPEGGCPHFQPPRSGLATCRAKSTSTHGSAAAA